MISDLFKTVLATSEEAVGERRRQKPSVEAVGRTKTPLLVPLPDSPPSTQPLKKPFL